MIRFYTLALAATLALPMAAQRQTATKARPATNVASDTKGQPQLPETKVLNPWKTAAEKHLLAPSAQEAADKIDTLLLTKVTVEYDGELSKTTTFSYDDNGYRKTMELRDANGNLQSATRYSYTLNADGIWTTKIVEELENNAYRVTFKEEREIDSQHRVTARKIYEIKENDGTYTPVLSEAITYDYAHPIYDSEGNTTYGHVAQTTRYDTSTGEQSRTSTYSWMESAHQYVLTYSESTSVETDYETYYRLYVSNKTTAEAIEGGYRTTSYSRESSTDDFAKTREVENYVIVYTDGSILDGGELEISYENGTKTSMYGSKTVFAANTPEQGWDQWTYYEYEGSESGEWQMSSRYEKYGMPANGGLADITGSKAIVRSYNASDGEWRWFSTFTYEQVNGELWKICEDYSSYGTYNYYAKRTDSGFSSKSSTTMFTETTGVIWTSEEIDGTWATIGKCFDQNGFTSKEMKQETAYVYAPFNHQYTVSADDDNSSYTIFYEKEGDSDWTIKTEYDTNTSGYASGVGTVKIRKHYTYNADGTLKAINYYCTAASYNDGEEFENQRYEFEYSDKLLSRSEYLRYTTSSSLTLDSKTSYTLLDDGTVRYNKTSYYSNGKVEDASQTDYKGGITTYYTYDESTKQFTVRDTYYETSYSETSADGVRTSYTVEYDDDNNPSFVSKSEEYESDGKTMRASYTYDKTTGKWVGEEKYEQYSIDVPFKYYDSPIDPEDAYNDEYAVSPERESSSPIHYMNETVYLNSYVAYSWDAASDSWVANNEPLSYEMPDEHTLIYSNSYQGYGDIVSGKIVTNEDFDLISEEVSSSDTNEEGTETNAELTEYEYNTNGWLTKKTETTTRKERWNETASENTTVTTYEYTLTSIFASSIDEVKGAEMQLQLNGKNIASATGTPLCVYDNAGRMVAKGVGSVTLASAGVYIVKSPKGTCKIFVK